MENEKDNTVKKASEKIDGFPEVAQSHRKSLSILIFVGIVILVIVAIHWMNLPHQDQKENKAIEDSFTIKEILIDLSDKTDEGFKEIKKVFEEHNNSDIKQFADINATLNRVRGGLVICALLFSGGVGILSFLLTNPFA